MGGAIEKIPKQVNVDVGFNVAPPPDWGAYMPPDLGQYMPAWGGAMADGGDFMVNRPTLFLAGERGPERATFSGANHKRGGGGMSTAALEQQISGLRADMARRDRLMTRQIRDAVLLAQAV